MKKKWRSRFFAFIISITLALGSNKAMAGEKHKELLNVSHRGASGYAPEHTLISYEMGEKLNGDYIEIDLQMTKDKQLVAMHDETLDRTTNGKGFVKNYTLAEIKQLDAGSWFNKKYPQNRKRAYEGATVPTLEEIFQYFGPNANYYIETKSPQVYPEMENELLYLINKYGINKNTLLIQSFSAESLLKIHELDHSIKLVQLFLYTSEAVITEEEIKAIKKYAIGIGPNYAFLSKEYVEKVTASGLEIHPYTVNDKETMKTLIDWGVTGMFTNFPDVLFNVKKESAKATAG
ncbi:glycerophosphodiester phosphodiesterase [Domibacillus indicus]|uniref:glycerophosphodiester phosphodiesterase n=1 Tax=Domibacillus indicus TaxID=1437523 RepID=UPI000617F81B